ncbi:MAG: hypothetical protein JSU04_20355 [Bdellovibrionales bacterium]|nr:hypothetical protein [Bdellovibrionales bacterium]
MKNYLLVLLCLPFVTTACTTTYHRAENTPVHFEDGSTQVKLKFDDESSPATGTEVTALNKTCTTKYFKERERLNCIRKLASIGKVVGVNKEIVTVEFKQGTAIGAETEFEVLKGEAK